MDRIRRLLDDLGVDSSGFEEGHRIRRDVALESSETVELEQRLRRDHGVAVDLWDVHDYTLGELHTLIEGSS